MKRSIPRAWLAVLTLLPAIVLPLYAGDWPIYKGNIYYTGNNDEITVKNGNLKWLFQADEAIFSPIVSDGKIYFVDIKKNVYCVDEEKGKLVWKIDLIKISSRFTASSKVMGKVKYPLIKGDGLYLTDNIAMYCINKHTGDIVWARTGMQDEKKFEDLTGMRREKKTREKEADSRFRLQPQKPSTATVDNIYSDPVINDDLIYYGTRNVFISRQIADGHLRWDNRDIRTYSGFPSFYDEYIFTQSMDYETNRYTLYCMLAGDGTVKWKKDLEKPYVIFSPVVYRGRLYIPNGKKMLCLDLKNGEPVWEKAYPDYITSNPSFTEREILFAVGNRQIVFINPDGVETASVDPGEGASPYFVTIRDRIYIASTFRKEVGGRQLPYASLRAIGLGDRKAVWEYRPQFPGGAHQPIASKGIMFLPAGNYLYAVGTDYYPRVIDGGSGYYDPYNSIDPEEKKPDDAQKKKFKQEEKVPEDGKEIPLRRMKVTVNGSSGESVPAEVEIRKWHRGKLIYSKKATVTKKDQEIEVPDMDDVELTAAAEGYVPKKVIIEKTDKDRVITLDPIEAGRGIVVENIHFELDAAHLKKESLNILDRMIEAMKRNRRIRIEVQGHTDSTGPDDYNQRLSERRADAVAEYMIKNGISPERIRGVGFGEKRPLTPNNTREGRAKNRRTEFLILDR